MDTHRQVRVSEGIDYFLEEVAKDLPPAGAFPELNVCKLARHPTGFGSQVTIGAVEARHHIIQQQPFQLILVWRLYMHR